MLRSKRQIISSMKKNLLENRFWDSAVSESEISGASLEWIKDFREMIGKITSEEIRAAAEKYFNTDSYIDVTLYPENWKEKIESDSAE